MLEAVFIIGLLVAVTIGSYCLINLIKIIFNQGDN